MTCAKGLTAGYAPGGAVLVNDRIAQHFDENVLLCGLTTYAHPLTVAAIVATIETMRDEGLVAGAAARGKHLGERLAYLARSRPVVGETRGIGLLWALELVVPGTRTPLAADVMARVAAGLKRRHIHLHKRDNLLYVAPPLVVTEAEIDEFVPLLGAAIDEAQE
jgi:taurine--2-oxoglutarate transaminase